MRFVRTSCGGYLIFFYESFGVHRGLFPKVPYVGVGKAHDLSAEDLGWRSLNPCGSYVTVSKRDFPIQADVTVKLGTVAKLS